MSAEHSTGLVRFAYCYPKNPKEMYSLHESVKRAMDLKWQAQDGIDSLRSKIGGLAT